MTAPAEKRLNLRPRITESLARLRAAIRRYVVIESLTTAGIIFAFWCLVFFAFDYLLLFTLFGVDYVREGSFGVKLFIRGIFWAVLLGALGYILIRKLLLRYTRPVTDTELALLYERRFEKELGDRVISAVELSEQKRVEEHGWSWQMANQVAEDAEKRISPLSEGDILNRGRLQKLVFTLIALGLVLLLLRLFLPDASTIWTDRGLFLGKTPWPRAALLNLVNWDASRGEQHALPYGSELRITARASKWVLKDATQPDGWRTLRWADLLGENTTPPWEFEAEALVSQSIYAQLPADWQKLDWDAVEAMINSSNPKAAADLGRSSARKLLEQLSENQQSALPPEVVATFPESWKNLSRDDLKAAFAASISLSTEEVKRISDEVPLLRPTAIDFFSATFNGFHLQGIPNIVPPFSAIQQVAFNRDASTPVLVLRDQDRLLLPSSWQQLPVRDFQKRLKSFIENESAEVLGSNLMKALATASEKLEGYAAKSRFATPKHFRKLLVPDKVILEFEQLAEGEDRRSRGRKGQPEVKRNPGSNDFSYEFKKVERAMRLRAYIPQYSTLWHSIDIRPLPSLASLSRSQEEPGYLHGSNSIVVLPKTPVSLEGEESRIDVPVGTSMKLEAVAQKPLKTVTLVSENTLLLPQLDHKPGSESFIITPRQIGTEDNRFSIQMTDMDGITGARKIALIPLADKAPEFPKAQFEAINRKLVTPIALLPLSVNIRDDVAISSASYIVTIQKMDRTTAFEVEMPFRSFSPVKFTLQRPAGTFFEQKEDATPSGILAGMRQRSGIDGLQFVSHLAAAPTSNWPSALWPIPYHEPVKEFALDYQDRATFGPVLRYEDEFLDSRQIRGRLNKPLDVPLMPTPYRMLVRLAAKDNRVRMDGNVSTPMPQEGRSSETFEFQVVSEQEVLLEMGKREEDLRDRFDDALMAVKKIRSDMKRVRDELDPPGKAKETEIRRAVSDAQDAGKALAQLREMVDVRVLREFRQVYREMALNRCSEIILTRVDGKICQPLTSILQPGQQFTKLEEAIDQLQRRMDVELGNTPATLLAEPVAAADRLIVKMEEILAEMKKMVEFNQLLQQLREAITTQQQLNEMIKKELEKRRRSELDDLK